MALVRGKKWKVTEWKKFTAKKWSSKTYTDLFGIAFQEKDYY